MEYYEERFDKPDFWESPVYEGDIPSIVGKRIAVVRVGFKESLIYCSDKQIASLRDKYHERFVRIAGTVERDPKLPRLPKKPKYDVHGDEIDELALWADRGLEMSLEDEIDRLPRRRRIIGGNANGEEVYRKENYVKSDEEPEDEEAPTSVAFDRVVTGIKTLKPREFELFRLWERGFSDSSISTTLGIKHESVTVIRRRIYDKLKLCYGAQKPSQFSRLLVRLHVYARKNNMPLLSDQYSSSVKSRGKYARNPFEFSPGLSTKKQPVSIGNEVFADKNPETMAGEVGPIEKVELQRIERGIAVEIADLGPANGPGVNRIVPEWNNVPEKQNVPVVSFNQFIDSYGSRKDAVKALNQFNKLNALDKLSALEFISTYKRSVSNVGIQYSPYLYLTIRPWATTTK